MRETAKATGEEKITYKCGPKEIMLLSLAAHRAMVASNQKQHVVLAGSRRDGWLAWRPVLAQSKFVRADSQSWCKNEKGEIKFPQRSHRMKESWLDARYDWLDEAGRPKKEDWSRCSDCSKDDVEQMAFLDPHIVDAKFTTDYKIMRGGQEITVPVIDLDFDGHELFEAELLDEMTKTPKERRLQRRLEHQKDVEAVEANKTPVRKRRIDYAMRDLDKSWHDGMDEDLKTKTTEEIFDLLLPRSSLSKQMKPKPFVTKFMKD